MSGTVDHDVAAAQVEPGFSFVLSADEAGVVELKFKKDAPKIFQVLLFAMNYINGTFDQPYATLGEFVRSLADIADQLEAQCDADKQGSASEEGSGEQTPE